MGNVEEHILEQSKKYNKSLIVSNLYLNLYFGKSTTVKKPLKAFRNNPNIQFLYLDANNLSDFPIEKLI